jgi:5-keto 4-deoxyuronate isomerase
VVSFLQVSPPKPYLHLSPTHATCPAHLIILDLISRTISGEEHKSLSSSLYSLLHSPVSSTIKSVGTGCGKFRLFWMMKYSACKWNIIEGNGIF